MADCQTALRAFESTTVRYKTLGNTQQEMREAQGIETNERPK